MGSEKKQRTVKQQYIKDLLNIFQGTLKALQKTVENHIRKMFSPRVVKLGGK